MLEKERERERERERVREGQSQNSCSSLGVPVLLERRPVVYERGGEHAVGHERDVHQADADESNIAARVHLRLVLDGDAEVRGGH